MAITGLSQNQKTKVMTSARNINDAYNALQATKSGNAMDKIGGIAQLGKMIALLFG